MTKPATTAFTSTSLKIVDEPYIFSMFQKFGICTQLKSRDLFSWHDQCCEIHLQEATQCGGSAMRASKKKTLGITAVLGGGMLFAGIASATPVTMNFDGINTGDQVSNFYDGGQATIAGLVPDGPIGPNYGVVWSYAQTSDLTSSLSGPPAPPSAPNYITLINTAGGSSSATMDVAAGFGSTGFSFYYFGAPTVAVYGDMDGGGSLLASETFGTCASTSFCSSGLMFAGDAMSVVFRGPGVFDNISFNMTPKAVPEPAAAGIFGFGVVLIGLFAGLRRRVA